MASSFLGTILRISERLRRSQSRSQPFRMAPKISESFSAAQNGFQGSRSHSWDFRMASSFLGTILRISERL